MPEVHFQASLYCSFEGIQMKQQVVFEVSDCNFYENFL